MTAGKKDGRLTVIIPFLNEGEEVGLTVKSIRDTAGDAVGIIVINDLSDDGYDYGKDLEGLPVRYVRNTERRGVAGCRDYGVSLCGTPYFLLLDAHMRFYDGRWADIIAGMLEEDDRRILCCQGAFLRKDASGTVYVRKECPPGYGARIRFDGCALWPDITWRYEECRPGEDTEPIPVVLGAGYAASVRYWKYLRGLEGLHCYGSDEPYISLKVWMEGGRCVLMKNVVAGHIYRDRSPFARYLEEEIYNRLMIAHTLFPGDYRRTAHAVASCRYRVWYTQALQILERNRAWLDGLKAYYRSIMTVPFLDVAAMNRNVNPRELEDAKACVARADEFCVHLLRNMPEACGLYDGKTAALVWMCLYAGYTHSVEAAGHAGKILAGIQEAVGRGGMPRDFAGGAAGIGWALITLHNGGYLPDIPSGLLDGIDGIVLGADTGGAASAGADGGAAGLFAYLSSRKRTAGCSGRMSGAAALRGMAEKVLDTSYDVKEVYYALSFLDDDAEQDSLHDIGEWAGGGTLLPEDSSGWDTSYRNGCIGTFVKSFLLLERAGRGLPRN